MEIFYIVKILHWIADSVFIKENTGDRKPLFWHTLRSRKYFWYRRFCPYMQKYGKISCMKSHNYPMKWHVMEYWPSSKQKCLQKLKALLVPVWKFFSCPQKHSLRSHLNLKYGEILKLNGHIFVRIKRTNFLEVTKIWSYEFTKTLFLNVLFSSLKHFEWLK